MYHPCELLGRVVSAVVTHSTDTKKIFVVASGADRGINALDLERPDAGS